MNYIVKHAIENVWCAPRQDHQFILRPQRISRDGGEVVQIESDWLDVYLPDRRYYYHLYQVGRLHPDELGLFPIQNEWVTLTDVSNKMGMIADLYTAKGVLMPKFEVYYMVTAAKNLIIATRMRPRELGISYNDEDVFMRVYSNAFFNSPRSNGHVLRTYTQGMVIALAADVLTMQQTLLNYKARSHGYAWAVINGKFAEVISPFNCKVGDLVDIVYDSSVQKVVEYQIKDMAGFDSILDSQRKYLMHYQGTTERIEYKDDIDMFLIERPAVGPANGLYHHQNTERSLRMITHRDYAINAQIIDAFVDGHPTWVQAKDLRIMALIRESGYNRPLVFENNRIHELYKLKDADIVGAMVGEYSAVPNWNAAVLENSNYTKLMGYKDYTDFTIDKVQSAYGYNAISKIIGESPIKVTVNNGIRMISVPLAYREDSTVFEYDVNGVLVAYNFHVGGAVYVLTSPAAALAEFSMGQGNQFLDEIYDTRTQVLNPKFNYRMYICDKIDGVSQENWRDVTGSGQYSLINNNLTWLINLNNFSTLVRSDSRGISYVLDVDASGGVVEFILHKVQTKGGVWGATVFDVPMGELDLIMNGRSLIEGIDYVGHFPKYIITNKKFLIDPQTARQQIVVRFSGFCKKDLTSETYVDRGFVKWGLISRNATYNIRDDRVLRIVFDGRVWDRKDLKYSEDDQAYILPNAYNGRPYLVRDAMVPMRQFANGDSYELREASRVIDKSVSDYLSMMLPEPVIPTPNVIDERYPLYSPFLSKLTRDLVNGVIVIDESMSQHTPQYVRLVCAPYEYLLEFDQATPGNRVDPDYVIVHPVNHNNVTTVSVSKYNFLQQANLTYLEGSVVLNHFFQIV